jgi:MtN3 and saliva related transmembrane protein
MKFEPLDPNVPLGMNVMLIIANVINVVYNIPQMVKTYQMKSTRDFSGWFLSLRILGNAIWVVYSIYVANLLMLINNVVTVVASVFVGYYKVREMLQDRRLSAIDHVEMEQTIVFREV